MALILPNFPGALDSPTEFDSTSGLRAEECSGQKNEQGSQAILISSLG
jgi:hypothetical protein